MFGDMAKAAISTFLIGLIAVHLALLLIFASGRIIGRARFDEGFTSTLLVWLS